MKARIERERIPPGEDPEFHLKLGRGSLSDVEFTVQLLQLQHGRAGHRHDRRPAGARRAPTCWPTTTPRCCAEAYRFCERTRNRWFLVEQRARRLAARASPSRCCGWPARSAPRPAELRERLPPGHPPGPPRRRAPLLRPSGALTPADPGHDGPLRSPGGPMDATAIRAELDHSVVDADGHIIEYVPALRDLIGDDAGGELADRFTALATSSALRARARRRDRAAPTACPRTGWWGVPARNTLDRATAMLPGLLYDRLDELGIDVAVLYPTVGLTVDGARRRRAAPRPSPARCNRYYAEAYAAYSDRLIPVGGHPDVHPDEAHRRARPRRRRARAQGCPVRRARAAPGPGPRGRPRRPMGRRPRPRQRVRLRPGVAALRRARRLADLPLHRHRLRQPGVAHQLRGQPHRQLRRRQPRPCAGRCSSAACHDPLPRAALRVPRGRRGWALQPARRPGRATGRSATSTRIAHYDPRNLDRALLDELVDRATPTGSSPSATRPPRRDPRLPLRPGRGPGHPRRVRRRAASARSPTSSAVFTEQCFFGCEADDPMNALAFDAKINPEGARLRAMFASDIGHWDVPDFRGVLPEAWELVEDGLVDRERVPRLHLRQRRAAVRRHQPRVLRRHQGGRRGHRPALALGLSPRPKARPATSGSSARRHRTPCGPRAGSRCRSCGPPGTCRPG